MRSVLKGIPVVLYERIPAGEDPFHAQIYEETPVTVENVLVTPSTPDDVVNELQLYGKRSEYTLSLPKGDNHVWEDCRVEFFGQSFRAFGPTWEYIEDLTPLQWNRKVRVERYE